MEKENRAIDFPSMSCLPSLENLMLKLLKKKNCSIAIRQKMELFNEFQSFIYSLPITITPTSLSAVREKATCIELS